MPKKKQNWKAGDIFAVPLSDGSFGLGQVISHEQYCMDSVLCAYSAKVVKELNAIVWQPKIEDIICIQITTRDALDKSLWQVINYAQPINVDNYFDIKSLRKAEYVGAIIESSNILDEFLTAYHGLTYWDDFYEPDYLDKLLLKGIKRPANVLLKPA